ncbi:MAG: hypothetical protein FJ220_01045, partial [Kiritimatiellaceae bacterium]|nr:hypothetical protein [Kiritimatiellaceae bacterium]
MSTCVKQWILGCIVGAQALFLHSAPLSFVDAKQQGSFNIGAAQVTMTREFEPEPVQRDVIALDYSIPDQTAAGVWAKDYPAELAAGLVDAVQIRIQQSAQQRSSVVMALELKGSTGTQRFPVRFGPEQNTLCELIDWAKIGALSETVLLIQRTDQDNPAIGRVRVDLTFIQLPLWQRVMVTLWGRMAGVLVIGILLAAVAAIFRRKQKIEISGRVHDVLLGCALTLMILSVLGVYAAGEMNRLNSGWICFAVTAVSVLISLLLKLAIAHRTIFMGETLRNGLFPGLLAAAASKEVLWQAPDSVVGFFQLSGFGATLFVFMYYVATIYRLIRRQKTLSLIGGSVLTATPFVFGLLLALQSFHLLAVQALLIFCVGELIANAWSLIHRDRLLPSLKMHRALIILSILVTLSPRIADLGSGAYVAALPLWLQPVAMIVATMLSQAPLWGIVYLFTSLILGAIQGHAPSGTIAQGEALRGMKKGMIFSGVLMSLFQVTAGLIRTASMQSLYTADPVWFLTIGGAIIFPLFKTIIETFDGSQSFFGRVACAYKDPVLYLRGFVLGLAIAIGAHMDFADLPTTQRIGIGFFSGIAVFGGVSMIRDCLFSAYGLGGLKSWRYYCVESGLGAFIGAGIGFYLDAAQLPILQTKLDLYSSCNLNPADIVTRCQQLRTTAPNEFTALISRWGHIQLSAASGGVKILFNEALMGVIGWGIAAPLFAINKAFLSAVLNRDSSSIKRMATRQGLVELGNGAVYVLRWGLWMAPLIFTFLRPMADATWYNQDGLIRTFFAIFNSLTRNAAGFTDWSLTVFSWIIGYAAFQVLIWIDHMGLRVATLVNLSFLGVDQLDERCATFVGADATARFIPEAVKRFTTWAPLLIPFYLPKGDQWAQVFSAGAAIQARPAAWTIGWPLALGLIAAATLFFILLFTLRRALIAHHAIKRERPFRLVNNKLAVKLKENGELYSFLTSNEIGINRCSFEIVDPSGCLLFVVEAGKNGAENKVWPIVGNFPGELFTPSKLECDSERLQIINLSNDVLTTVTITLPGRNDAVALWQIELQDRSGTARDLKVVPYIEWMLNRPEADRNHTQYNRLYPEMSYNTEFNALEAFHRSTKLHGVLASAIRPIGVLTGRIDFIGRGGSIWSPRALQTLAFQDALNSDALPTFDPIGALLLDAPVPAGGKMSHTILVGCSESKARISEMILGHLKPQIDASLHTQKQAARTLKIGHGEIPAGTPDRYTEYESDGNTLRVLTPFTPRPFDHEMANAMGHVVAVTNRGLHSSASGNAQQNRLTPDWADLTGAQVPSEAIYMYDEQTREWFSPCYEPLKDRSAAYDVYFSLDGTAVFKMKKGGVETKLSVHVPLHDPAGVYLLRIRNTGKTARRLRIAPYFQIALAHSPEYAGALLTSQDAASGAFFFENPR